MIGCPAGPPLPTKPLHLVIAPLQSHWALLPTPQKHGLDLRRPMARHQTFSPSPVHRIGFGPSRPTFMNLTNPSPAAALCVKAQTVILYLITITSLYRYPKIRSKPFKHACRGAPCVLVLGHLRRHQRAPALHGALPRLPVQLPGPARRAPSAQRHARRTVAVSKPPLPPSPPRYVFTALYFLRLLRCCARCASCLKPWGWATAAAGSVLPALMEDPRFRGHHFNHPLIPRHDIGVR